MHFFSVIYTSCISSSSFFTLSPNKSSALFSIAVITLNYEMQSHCLASCKPALNFYLIYFFRPVWSLLTFQPGCMPVTSYKQDFNCLLNDSKSRLRIGFGLKSVGSFYWKRVAIKQICRLY